MDVKPTSEDRDVVGRLLDIGGARVPPPLAVADRVRLAVHAEWRQRVRTRRAWRWALAVGLPAAVAVAIAVNVRPDKDDRLSPPVGSVSPPVVVATLERVAGSGFRVFDAVAGRWTVTVPGAAVQAGALLETGPDGRGALRLTTGASLRIGGETRMRLLSGGGVSLERGAVYVDNPGHGAPAVLVVRTVYGVVREIGTQFEVRLDATALRVRVREGAVALERDHQTDTATAGIELRVAEGGALARRQIPISGGDWAWAVGVAPPMPIEGARLDAFLTWATRELGWRVTFARDGLERESSGTILHGTVAGLTPDEAIESVLATCGLSHRVQDGTLVIGEADANVR